MYVQFTSSVYEEWFIIFLEILHFFVHRIKAKELIYNKLFSRNVSTKYFVQHPSYIATFHERCTTNVPQAIAKYL